MQEPLNISPLRVLHLEDCAIDCVLVEHALKDGGLLVELTRVSSREAFAEALERGDADLVLADYKLPGFDGLAALYACRQRRPDLPFIMLSGSMGEEAVIEALKSGATDIVLKDRMFRLVPAIRRAMREVGEIADRKRIELQFVEAQKMEVVGHLAGGVAHDFNNILSVILGYSDMILGQCPPGNPVRPYAEEVRHAAERAAGLTRQLLVFSRKQKIVPEILDLNKEIEQLHKMLVRLIDENIQLTIVHGKALGRVRADAGHVGQVLMNLVVNARDAMPQGGKLTIETQNVTIRNNGVPGGEFVMMSVGDTGTGMTEEVRARIFQPFFTTKPKNRGTGLGLATCQTIVEQAGGHIEVESALGVGTMFNVYFPRVADTAAKAAAVESGPLPRGEELVLLVEDERPVRHLAVNILRKQGYEVLSASNGQDGLNVARDHRGRAISLVITDVIMPQMSGKVMAEWLSATYPNLKVLFTSGYTDDAIAHHGVLDAGVAFLPKPYTPAALAHKVRAMLDGK